MKPVIGIDFDNTIVCYDELAFELAWSERLVPQNIKKDKQSIRNYIRQLEDGEIKWQKLQVKLYGKEMLRATLMQNVNRFFKFCKKHSILIYIVSHKTQFASIDTLQEFDLRKVSLKWMENHNFFQQQYLNLSKSNVFFESTREKKIQRIKKLYCTHFIDDLEEIFLEDSFPDNIIKIHYTKQPSQNLKNTLFFANWEQIITYFKNEYQQ